MTRGRPARLGAALLTIAFLAAAPRARAQGTAVDNAVARARALVEAGDGRAGRQVLDSMVREAGVATPALGELLYWRGLLAESSSDAERDWRRLLLEVPMSPRAEDALLRLAQLDQMRGRPADSRVHLERLVREYRDPGSQARAHFWLARAWFDENDRPRACGALEVVRRDMPANAVELRQQADDLHSRCRGVTPVAPLVAVAPAAPPVAPAAAPPTAEPPTAEPPAVAVDSARLTAERVRRDSLARVTATRDSVVRDSLAQADAVRDSPVRVAAVRDSVARATFVRDSLARADAVRDSLARATAAREAATRDASARPAGARYSVQLAALNTLRQAEQFAQRFRTQGISDARVDGTSAPFRVRTGYYATRAQANARLAELKAKGYDGFIAELTP